MKPPKFLLNPVQALNFLGGGRSWSGRGDEGGVACQFFYYYFCFACLYKLIK